MNKNRVLLFVLLYGIMFCFGFIENIKGVSYPLIKAEFDVSYGQQAILVSVLSLCYVVFCIVGGILIGRFGTKTAFFAGFVLMILGLGGAFFMPRYLSVSLALFVIAAGFGVFEVSTNALGTQLFTTKAALFMNLLHFFYGAGSSASPRIAGMLAGAFNWRYVYLFAVPVVILFFIPFLFARFPQGGASIEENDPPQKTAAPKTKRVSFFAALKTPMVWTFSVVLGLMVAVELSTPNWAGLYFNDVYDLDPKTSGAAFLSNFFILFTLSRLLSGFIIEKAGYLRCLFISAIASVLILLAGFILGDRGIYALPVLGFFVAVFWPTLLAAAMGYFREDAPVMTSAIIVIAGTLNSGIQFLMGLINRHIGPAWGYRSTLIFALLVVAAMIVLIRRIQRPYRPPQTGNPSMAGAYK